MTTAPRLDLVVGCNGAGKSTLIAETIQPDLVESTFVNADVIAKQRWPDDAEGNSYEAAQIAAAWRDRLIAERSPLIAETVFSHPSKLDLIDDARDAGFVVIVHAVMIPARLAVLRVRSRAESGGHDVPVDKIKSRYDRLWPNVALAITRADRARVWDNSRNHSQVVADFVAGTAARPIDWPAWTPTPLRVLSEHR
ncbi:zeta toxin family protein [Gordonia sp. (in: high G+C Gram-positive bacteria)]|uniref:zeta toxin family protein n=1 Tax=Gordonia sp. (in: high G+C Gram-positive bacteria) TaxID=84139 RepID=UPI003F973AB7